jgi:hypothetical protein
MERGSERAAFAKSLLFLSLCSGVLRQLESFRQRASPGARTKKVAPTREGSSMCGASDDSARRREVEGAEKGGWLAFSMIFPGGGSKLVMGVSKRRDKQTSCFRGVAVARLRACAMRSVADVSRRQVKRD